MPRAIVSNSSGVAALAPVVACALLHEAVPCEGAQVVAARRGALADVRSALGRGRVAVQLQPGENSQSRRVSKRAQRGGRGEAGVFRYERDIAKILFYSFLVKDSALEPARASE